MGFMDNVAAALQIAVAAIENYERGQQIANLVLGDQGVIGSLEATGRVDVYTITLSPRGNYQFQLTQPVFANFDLYVLDGQGRLIASDESQDNPSVVQVSGSGQCVVAVKSDRGIGRYSLAVTRY